MTPDIAMNAEENDGVRVSTMAILVASAFVIGASETLVWFSMRAVMALGGTVAVGGPYAITSAAPGWIMVMPAAIIALVIAMMTSSGLSGSRDTPSLMLMAWSALFLSLGWNFLEFGVHAPGGGVSISWLLCAVLFAVMGGGGLYVLVDMRRGTRELDQQRAAKTGTPATHAGWRAYQIANAVAVIAGVAAGWGLFALLGR